MQGRFLTPKSGAEQLIKRRPSLQFGGSTKGEWQAWRRRFSAGLKRIMGPTPPAVPLRVKVLSHECRDEYVREKIAFNPDPFSTVVAYLLIPSSPGRKAGVLCSHGHGGGKDDLFGDGPPYHGIAERLVRAGYVVIAPDWRSFGERQDDKSYIGHFGDEHGRDGCDLSYMLYGYFGYQMLTLDVADARRCLDVLAARRDVDASRLGMVGLSFGGTMATYTAATDPRVKAVVISGYLSTIADALGDRGGGNTCGSQFLFGLRTIGDIADVAGLIAPRACQVQIGSRDQVFIEADAVKAAKHLAKTYRAAGAMKQLEIDRFDGGHELDVEAALDFLQRQFSRTAATRG